MPVKTRLTRDQVKRELLDALDTAARPLGVPELVEALGPGRVSRTAVSLALRFLVFHTGEVQRTARSNGGGNPSYLYSSLDTPSVVRASEEAGWRR